MEPKKMLTTEEALKISEEARVKERYKHYYSSFVPPSFRDSIREVKGSPLFFDVYNRVTQKEGTRRSVLLTGNPGSGKTCAALAVGLEYCRVGKSYFMKGFDLVERYEEIKHARRSWDDDIEPEIEPAKRKGLLVIDDMILDDNMPEHELDAFLRVVDYRGDWTLPTIFTTNQRPEKLIGKVDERILSRLKGMCEVVLLEGKDRRSLSE